MTTSLRTNRWIVWASVFALSTGLAWAAGKALGVGDPLPELKAPAVEGAVPAMKGKVVLLDFWASWCGPCRKSFPELDTLYKKHRAEGLVVIGVSVDKKPEDMNHFLDQLNPSFPIVRDRDQKLVASVGISAMPTSLLVDRKGVVRNIHKGFHGAETVDQLEKEISELLKEKP